jgi:hypothetical protein
VVLLALGLVALSIGPAAAQTTDLGGPVIYRLEKGSTYQHGCFAPCECPLFEEVPVRGTFILTPAGSDPLFTYYKVTDINWTVSLGDPELRITRLRDLQDRRRVRAIHPYRLLSESTFQRGCFGPCLCALWEEQPIRGTFALVPLQQSPLFTEVAVVNVDWVVTPLRDVAAMEIPVRGSARTALAGR